MIDNSSNLTLNIAALPVNKKKVKRKSDEVLVKKPVKTIAPKAKKPEISQKPIQIKPIPPESGGILKKSSSVPSQSIWKKLKQSNKKGNDLKLGFIQPAAKPTKVVKKRVKVNDQAEIISQDSAKSVFEFGKQVSFKLDQSSVSNISNFGKLSDESNVKEKNDDLSDFNFVKKGASDKPKVKNFNKLGNDNNFKRFKNFSLNESESECQTFKSKKTSSLFWNNPEIPEVPHRAVKPAKEAVFSKLTFKDLNLHSYMVKYLEDSMGLTKATTVQEKSIPVLLEKKDALIKSQTGSGKTLAFALPILHELQGIRPKINRSDGVLVLIVVPTRELAMQTYEVFNKLVKSYTWIVPGYLVGGEKRKSEKARLRKGISILIGTPGRLLDHVQHTKALNLDKVSWLVIDEADRLLDMGYEKDVSELLDTLNKDESKLLKPNYLYPEAAPSKKEEPKNRQTVLLSATLTQKVEKLAGLSLKNPVFIDACEENLISSNRVPVFSSDIGNETDTMVLPEGLVQKYIVTPPKLKLVTLASFILWKSKLTEEKKMLIFLATQDMVDYHMELLTSVFSSSNDEDSDGEDSSHFSNSGIEFFKLHGNMKQSERTEVFKTFRKSHLGVLLCTDVASRGLDLPEVDWVIQYTGPTSVSDYVHRVGRTARGGQSGSSIIFLTPNEVSFIGKLENCQIRLREEKMETCLNYLLSLNPRGSSVQEEATNLQAIFENLVASEAKYYDLACKAFASWSRFYASYPRNMRDVFSVKTVHQGHYAKSFALRDAPSVIFNHAKKKNLNEERPARKRPKEQKESAKGKIFSGKSSFADISEFDSGLEPLRKKKK